MKIDDFILFSGSSVVYKGLVIKQPKLIEIGHIGETEFYNCLGYFLIDKETLGTTPEIRVELRRLNLLEAISLFILGNPACLQKYNTIFFMLTNKVLRINPETTNLELIGSKDEEPFVLANEDWKAIVAIIRQFFCLMREKDKKDMYNPKNRAAAEIAEKLRKARIKTEEVNSKKKNGGNKNSSLIFSQYCSILSIGNRISLNTILNEYTVYQLFNQMKRFNKHDEYKTQILSMMHGAKVDKVTNWFDSITDK